MFDRNFYPTPPEVAAIMLEDLQLNGKHVWEPSAGKGDLVKILQERGAKVIACELNEDLRKIVQTICTVIAPDCLTVTADEVSHVDYIVMNPPFDQADKHILHAFSIAPPGCKIRALCNLQTLNNTYTQSRQQLKATIEEHGSRRDLGAAFAEAERVTGTGVALVELMKPGANYSQEFEGFFMEVDPHEAQHAGLISYNVVREIVGRYVESVKIFDQQIETACRLNEMQGPLSAGEICISLHRGEAVLRRDQFKKSMQKSGWNHLFSKLNLEKYATKGLKEDINKFVEQQADVPFTMRNIYRMLEIIIGTTETRMDRAILEVFDKVTAHHHENRHGLEGWQTNSHYLLTKRFIMPHVFSIGYSGQIEFKDYASYSYAQNVNDLVKTLCYISATPYENVLPLDMRLRYKYFLEKNGEYVIEEGYRSPVCANEEERIKKDQAKVYGSKVVEMQPVEWGKWFEWGFFRIRAYKKGTCHFEFLDEKLWATFNQRVAKLKGFPLPEKKEQTKWQQQRSGTAPKAKREYKVMETIKI